VDVRFIAYNKKPDDNNSSTPSAKRQRHKSLYLQDADFSHGVLPDLLILVALLDLLDRHDLARFLVARLQHNAIRTARHKTSRPAGRDETHTSNVNKRMRTGKVVSGQCINPGPCPET
jgi:hypothetical protein